MKKALMFVLVVVGLVGFSLSAKEPKKVKEIKKAGVEIKKAGVAGLSARAADALKVDDEGFIGNWLVLGPISAPFDLHAQEESRVGKYFNNEQFEGQFKAAPKDGDKVKVGNLEMAFSKQNADGAILKFPEPPNSLNIAVTYVVAGEDIADVNLVVGSDDSSCWRLNGQEIIRLYTAGFVRDQSKSQAVTLKKGVNVLMGTVINGMGATYTCARFLDKEGKPVKNVTVQLAPAQGSP